MSNQTVNCGHGQMITAVGNCLCDWDYLGAQCEATYWETIPGYFPVQRLLACAFLFITVMCGWGFVRNVFEWRANRLSRLFLAYAMMLHICLGIGCTARAAALIADVMYYRGVAGNPREMLSWLVAAPVDVFWYIATSAGVAFSWISMLNRILSERALRLARAIVLSTTAAAILMRFVTVALLIMNRPIAVTIGSYTNLAFYMMLAVVCLTLTIRVKRNSVSKPDVNRVTTVAMLAVGCAVLMAIVSLVQMALLAFKPALITETIAFYLRNFFRFIELFVVLFSYEMHNLNRDRACAQHLLKHGRLSLLPPAEAVSGSALVTPQSLFSAAAPGSDGSKNLSSASESFEVDTDNAHSHLLQPTGKPGWRGRADSVQVFVAPESEGPAS